MIGTISVKIAAHNPSFPLEPVFTFVNSAQSFRIMNVPRKIGQWDITKVFVNLAYPDNTTVTKECVLNGSVWVGTVEGCATSGTSTNGFIVTASGIDENGNAVTNYVLGAGDLYVQRLDGTVAPDLANKMYFYEEIPTDPNEGDTTFIQGTLNVYDGTNWVPVAVSPDPSFIIDADGNKICADRTVVMAQPVDPVWTITDGTNTYTLTGTKTFSSWDDGEKKYETYMAGDNAWVLKYYEMPIPGVWVTRWWEQVSGTESSTYVSYPQHGFTATWAKPTTSDVLATMSDLPTKTSDLTNDSGFITSADVPTKTSDLTNDSGFITSADIITKRDLTDFNIYVRPNSTTTIYVGTSPCEWNESSQRWEGDDAFVTPPETPQSNTYFVMSGGMGDDVELAPPHYTGVIHGDYSDIPVTCSPSDTIAKTSQVPTKTSDLTNDSGFITSAEIEPYHYALEPTTNTGIANKAYMLTLGDRVSSKPVDGGVLLGDMKTFRDLTYQFRAKMGYTTY